MVETIKLIPGYDPFRDAGNCVFDEERAQRAVDFFSACLVHIKGKKAGKPFVLERWQQAIIANIFGWLREDGTRRYRTVLIYVPRKNGKTALAAGIGLLFLFTDGEWGAEIYAAARDRDQATLLFDVAKSMVLREPVLLSACTVYQKSIVIDEMVSSFKAISADAASKHGYNAHCAIVDELHAQPDSELVDVLETSMGAREQPVMIYVTTADFDRESVCNEKHDYACKVRDGVINDPEFLPVIYETDRDDDWNDEAVWARVNPNLGVSVNLEYLRKKYQQAKELPRYENTFRRLFLNQRTGQKVRWIPLDVWDECTGKDWEMGKATEGGLTRTAFEEFLSGRECWAGLDLSSTKDVTALVLAFPESDGFYLLPYFWIPEEGARQREKRDRVPYVTWAREGWLEMTEGNVVDYKAIREHLNKISNIFTIREIGFDPWNAEPLIQQLGEDDGFQMVKFRQGFFSMSSPSKEFEKLIMGRAIAHGGNPVLRWMASNVSIRTDPAGNIKPDKERSSEKIDGIVAAIMAIGRAALGGGEKESIYKTRGLLQI